MRATAILVRYQNGWRWVRSEQDPQIEICQGHAGDSSEVVRKAGAELATYDTGQTEITVGIDIPPGEPVPGIAWREGHELNVDGSWREVEALTMTLDDANGRWTDVPQFGDILDPPDARIARTFRAIGGLTSGTSRLARPVADVQRPGVKP